MRAVDPVAATISCQAAGLIQLFAVMVVGEPVPFDVTIFFSHKPIFMGAACARSIAELVARVAKIRMERIILPRI